MSFSESVIIPLSIFKKLKFEETRGNFAAAGGYEAILNNPMLPSSEKMQLVQHEKLIHKKPSAFPATKVVNKDSVLDAIETKYKPQVNSILDFILKMNKSVGPVIPMK